MDSIGLRADAQAGCASALTVGFRYRMQVIDLLT